MKRIMLLTVICIFFSMPSAFSASDGSEQGGFIQYPKADGYYESMVLGEPVDPVKAPTTATPQQKQGGKPQAAAAYTNSIGMEFVLIPAGTFLMGDGSDRKKTQHQVTINQSFYLGKYEVTQGQWAAVFGKNPRNFVGPNYPVTQVSWNDAQIFIRKLNEKEGHTRYRLPTEAEWEYSARAGTTTEYSFGNNANLLGQYAWYFKNAYGKIYPVGQKKPNPWGLYDIHGNAWEWVQDWYGEHNYNSSPSLDTNVPFSGSNYRVYRGGGCDLNEEYSRSASGGRTSADFQSKSMGFRLALSPEATSSGSATGEEKGTRSPYFPFSETALVTNSGLVKAIGPLIKDENTNSDSNSNIYRAKNVDISFMVERDDSGKVTGLVMFAGASSKENIKRAGFTAVWVSAFIREHNGWTKGEDEEESDKLAKFLFVTTTNMPKTPEFLGTKYFNLVYGWNEIDGISFIAYAFAPK